MCVHVRVYACAFCYIIDEAKIVRLKDRLTQVNANPAHVSSLTHLSSLTHVSSLTQSQ